MKKFLELAASRYAVREYRAEQVEAEKIAQIVEAARLAPTAANYQPFRLLVIQTQGREHELLRVYNRPWFPTAPVLICACGLPGQAWTRRDGKSYLDVDIAIVVDHMALAAADLGLGTCWVASFDVEAVRAAFGIPEEAIPLLLLTLGYPASQPPKEKERKPVSELVRYEHW